MKMPTNIDLMQDRRRRNQDKTSRHVKAKAAYQAVKFESILRECVKRTVR